MHAECTYVHHNLVGYTAVSASSPSQSHSYAALPIPRSTSSSRLYCLFSSGKSWNSLYVCNSIAHIRPHKSMAGHDRRQDDFLQSFGIPRAYYSDDDGRRPRATKMEDQLRDRSRRGPSRNKSANPHRDRITRARELSPPPRSAADRVGSSKRIPSPPLRIVANPDPLQPAVSNSRMPSPPPPINRRRPIRVSEQQDNTSQRLGAPDIYVIPPNQSSDRCGRDAIDRGRAASNPVKAEFAMSQPAPASPTTALPVAAGEIGSSEASERSGPSTPASNSIAGVRRSLSVDASRRLASSSGFLGDKVYRYTPLEAEEIRLVRVLAKRSSQVKCESKQLLDTILTLSRTKISFLSPEKLTYRAANFEICLGHTLCWSSRVSSNGNSCPVL